MIIFQKLVFAILRGNTVLSWGLLLREKYDMGKIHYFDLDLIPYLQSSPSFHGRGTLRPCLQSTSWARCRSTRNGRSRFSAVSSDYGVVDAFHGERPQAERSR